MATIYSCNRAFEVGWLTQSSDLNPLDSFFKITSKTFSEHCKNIDVFFYNILYMYYNPRFRSRIKIRTISNIVVSKNNLGIPDFPLFRNTRISLITHFNRLDACPLPTCKCYFCGDRLPQPDSNIISFIGHFEYNSKMLPPFLGGF